MNAEIPMADQAALMAILIAPHPTLKLRCRAVAAGDNAAVRALVPRMFGAMYHAPGIGLAAPQVGFPNRITVIDLEPKKRSLIELVNPVIVSRKGKIDSDEGCLSIPAFRDTIERAAEITVEYLDRQGQQQQLIAEGLLSFCLQHEIDHLDGVLFVDRMSKLKRKFFLKWYAREIENGTYGMEDPDL